MRLLPFLENIFGKLTTCSLKRRLDRGQSRGQDIDLSGEADKRIEALDNHIETGFQLATFQGPLCAEPVEGLAYFVENVEVDKEALEREIGEDFHRLLIAVD